MCVCVCVFKCSSEPFSFLLLSNARTSSSTICQCHSQISILFPLVLVVVTSEDIKKKSLLEYLDMLLIYCLYSAAPALLCFHDLFQADQEKFCMTVKLA